MKLGGPSPRPECEEEHDDASSTATRILALAFVILASSVTPLLAQAAETETLLLQQPTVSRPRRVRLRAGPLDRRPRGRRGAAADEPRRVRRQPALQPRRALGRVHGAVRGQRGRLRDPRRRRDAEAPHLASRATTASAAGIPTGSASCSRATAQGGAPVDRALPRRPRRREPRGARRSRRSATPPTTRPARGSRTRPSATRSARWKRYRGGRTTPIWIFDPTTHEVEQVPHVNASDTFPCWLGGDVYFASRPRRPHERLALHARVEPEPEQVTRFKDFDVRNMSAGGGVVAFEQAGAIHLLDPADGKATRLRIAVPTDGLDARPRWQDGQGLRAQRLDRAERQARGVRGPGRDRHAPEGTRRRAQPDGDARRARPRPGLVARREEGRLVLRRGGRVPPRASATTSGSEPVKYYDLGGAAASTTTRLEPRRQARPLQRQDEPPRVRDARHRRGDDGRDVQGIARRRRQHGRVVARQQVDRVRGRGTPRPSYDRVALFEVATGETSRSPTASDGGLARVLARREGPVLPRVDRQRAAAVRPRHEHVGARGPPTRTSTSPSSRRPRRTRSRRRATRRTSPGRSRKKDGDGRGKEKDDEAESRGRSEQSARPRRRRRRRRDRRRGASTSASSRCRSRRGTTARSAARRTSCSSSSAEDGGPGEPGAQVASTSRTKKAEEVRRRSSQLPRVGRAASTCSSAPATSGRSWRPTGKEKKKLSVDAVQLRVDPTVGVAADPARGLAHPARLLLRPEHARRRLAGDVGALEARSSRTSATATT